MFRALAPSRYKDLKSDDHIFGFSALSRSFPMRVLVHAPNIHTGGGLVLLKEFLAANDLRVEWAQLDVRARDLIHQQGRMLVCYVKRSVFSRLYAEWRLWRTCLSNDVVLCFNGLPPMLPVSGRVVVFVQNRLLVERARLAEYPLGVRVRIWMERLWSYIFQSRCSRYVVQTPSMATSLKCRLRHDIPISVVSFAPVVGSETNSRHEVVSQRFEFVYVASGEPHKNHKKLIEAWCLLAATGFRPSLALTLDPNAFPCLCEHIARAVEEYGLSVTNLGTLTSQDVDNLYRAAGAMIYPSTCESFGLPLIEAEQRGLPILAAELDYVRDVVVPVESFDPNSSVSIARAVKRYLGFLEPRVKIARTADFLAEVLR